MSFLINIFKRKYLTTSQFYIILTFIVTNGQFLREVKMLTKSEQNRLEKENSLLDSAYKLFTENGVENTSISSIVQKAGVAKGTFYLYFDNKYDLLERIILNKSQYVLSEAINLTISTEYDSFESEVIGFINHIIDYLKENKLLLKLIHKNLSWGIYRKAYRDYEEVNIICNMFEEGYKDKNLTEDEIKLKLFLIIELVGSVAYSSIILEEPVYIDEIKETLFDAVRKILGV